MTPRVQRLRQASLDTRPWLSAERAGLVTDAMQEVGALAPPLQRVAVFAHILDHKALYLGPDELIVGERGPSPKGTPTFPELCCHSLEDLEILNTRERISYSVSPEVRRTYAREGHPVLAGPVDARRDLPRDAARVAGGVRRRRLHRVHGAARAGPHRARRQDLSERVPGPRRRHRSRRWPRSTTERDPRAYDKAAATARDAAIAADAIIRFAGRHADAGASSGRRRDRPGAAG